MTKRQYLKDLLPIIEGLIFSLTLIAISAGLKIINPAETNWLHVGDGTMEIAWEFFRNQPLFQLPLGLNPKYGLEISSTMAFDGQIPLFSLIFHPFESFLPIRFQYLGIYLLICFALNYYSSKLIFRELNFNPLNSSLASIVLSTSPLILNRYVENTHYTLTSAFFLYFAILLILKSDTSFFKWILLYIFSILIFLYYTFFILIMHSMLMIYKFFNKKEPLMKFLVKYLAIFFLSLIFMYLIGFFYGGVSTADIGYGRFKSSLSSLFDPSGWSQIVPDLPETEGAYEGFSYVGIPSILLLIIFFSLIGKPMNSKSKFKVSFNILWLASISLYLFSLSNKIAIGSRELFEFGLPSQLVELTSTFRSTGRFAWLIVFVIFIWLIYSISLKISTKSMTILLSLMILFHSVDINRQLTSQRNLKFSEPYLSDLISPAWREIGNCYKKIRIYPPSMAPDNYYDFVNLAYQQDLSINTGRFGRGSEVSINNAYEKMHRDFIYSSLDVDSFYIFTTSPFVNPEIINFHKRQAIFSLNNLSGWGEMDEYTFLAPNIRNCESVTEIGSAIHTFGADPSIKYRGENLYFGLGQNSNKYILSGFSPLQEWGVWSVGNISSIVLNLKDDYKPSSISINGKSFPNNKKFNSIEIFINEKFLGNCVFNDDFSTCNLPLDILDQKNTILKIDFKPTETLGLNNLDSAGIEYQVGIGLVSLALN